MSRKALHAIATRVAVAALACLVCIFSSSLVPGAIAHALGQSYLYFQIAEDTLSARAEIPVQNLNEVLDLGLPTDQKVRRGDLEPHLEQIQAYVVRNLEIGCDPQVCNLVFQKYDFLNTTFSQFLQLDYAVEGFQTLPEVMQITYDVILAEQPQHLNMVLIEENWETGTFGNESNAALIFTEPDQPQTLDLSSGSLLQGLTGVTKLGTLHILGGVHHILFLIALLLPSVLRREGARWQPAKAFPEAFMHVIKTVTGFTIVHSIALYLATRQIVEVPPRLVESVVAAVIGLAAIAIFCPIFRGWIWFVIFAFGLFHGLGLANELTQLGVMSQHAMLSLFGFHLGVEVGQIAIIVVVLPLLYCVRTQRFYPRFVMRPGGVLLGAISLYWFIEQAFNVNIRVLPLIQGLLGMLSNR